MAKRTKDEPAGVQGGKWLETPALQHPCERCRKAAGENCVNYKGQRKAPCPSRGKPQHKRAPKSAAAVPMKQYDLYDLWEAAERGTSPAS